jgi:leucyl aminopeptidase
MVAKLTQNPQSISPEAIEKSTHVLMVMPEKRCDMPLADILDARLKRGGSKYPSLSKSPLCGDLPNGAQVAWVVLKDDWSTFERHTALRKAMEPLLEEQPATLAIAVLGNADQRALAAEAAVYCAWVNCRTLATRKKKDKSWALGKVMLFGHEDATGYADLAARAEGNWLVRTLTQLPANDLTPGGYRARIRQLAAQQDWACEEFDMKKLRQMGAGAFVAVAQGSDPEDAAIVHLTYTPKKAKKTVALVGKGICFDTGGHNLKPARYMHGMHEDMNGSAVALGILLAATQAGLPVKIDCWLAIAQNHISPKAYKQNDVVTALNGMTIEIIHTDAEGRMVLADTLTLASREKPDLMIDFATLTGSMMTALGSRYSGVIGNRPEWLCQAVGVGKQVGERVNAFPFDADYDEELDSDIADIKQCTLDGDADHIIAARFLSKFIAHDPAWLHVDLSAIRHKGGLGAVKADVSGFGVGLGLGLLLKTLEQSQ